MGVRNTSDTNTDCICATNFNCQMAVTVFGWQEYPGGGIDYNTPYLVPGMTTGCFTIDSLLLSTLECFYLDSCLSNLYFIINATFDVFNTDFTWFQSRLLVYDQESSRFPPNTTLLVIARAIMIEQWNSSVSFDLYYKGCAPIYCTYSYTTRAFNFIEILIKLVSMTGGLTIVLRLITPRLVELVFKLLRKTVKRQQRGNYCCFFLRRY